jgi:hypothetical protein
MFIGLLSQRGPEFFFCCKTYSNEMPIAVLSLYKVLNQSLAKLQLRMRRNSFKAIINFIHPPITTIFQMMQFHGSPLNCISNASQNDQFCALVFITQNNINNQNTTFYPVGSIIISSRNPRKAPASLLEHESP